jgi:glycosyltransferase involved in cell wall biosynthesis
MQEQQRMKLTAGLIVRNEGANLEACLSGIREHVDRLVIVDTGSTDKTPEIAKFYADTFVTFTDCNADGVIQDFSLARNHVMKFVDPDSWFFWCDGDDIVEGAEHLRTICNGEHDPYVMFLFPYEYSYDEQGNVTVLHWRERLVRPASGFEWKGPVHEVLMPKPELAGKLIAKRTGHVVIKHRRQGKAYDGGRNLRILEKWVAGEGKGDLRSLFYFGMELRKAGRTDEARVALTEYAEKSGWADEKCISMLELSALELGQGRLEESIKWGLQAQVTKSWPDPYYMVGYALHQMAVQSRDDELKRYNYARAAHYLRRGAEMGIAGTGSDTVLFSNPSELYASQRVLCACLGSIGDWQGAIESCELGLRGFPEDQGLLEYWHEFMDRRDTGKLIELVERLAQRGRVSREGQAIIHQALAGKFEVKIKRDVLPEPPKADGCLSVVFYTGPAWEDWTPATIAEGGMGGSETMCAELAKRLAAMGHSVRVYGQPTEEGMFDGVQYLHHDRWGDVAADVLVASRIPEAVDTGDFRLRLLWVHDVHCGSSLTRERMLRFDRVLALSQWHKRHLLEVYPMLDEERVVVTRNGIDLTRFSGVGAVAGTQPPLADTPAPGSDSDGGSRPAGAAPSVGVKFSERGNVRRDPHRAIYSSSPDRGLMLALELWPRIREQVEDAELHVYYGFENWEKAARLNPDYAAQFGGVETIDRMKAMLKQPGVHYHGRVSPKVLAEAFLASGVWFYPTWFSETSCITCMESQVAGCLSVTSNVAALEETDSSAHRFVPDAPDWYGSERHRDWCVERVVSTMSYNNDTTTRDFITRQASKRFGLNTLAADWHAMFATLLADVEENPVPRYVAWRAA